jgi:protein-S-isoprenylcysteine O-methyltransferase Ste14
MEPLIGNDQVASAIFAVVFGGWILFEIVFTGRKQPRRGARRSDRGSGLFVLGSMFAAFLIMAMFAASFPGTTISAGPWVVFAVGLLVALAGFGLRLWAIRVLGGSFTTVITARSDQQVVDHGPYRLIRHPSYAGALVTVLGAALCFNNWLSLLAVAPVFLAYSYRARVEEATLEDRVGQAYKDYEGHTKRLIPFLY